MREAFCGIFLFLAAAFTVQAQSYSNTSHVIDGFGGRSTGGVYSLTSAGAQPGGISESAAGDHVNQAGFLHTFFVYPALDHDTDGLPDEADPDNDNDTLRDRTELSGEAFDPVTPTDVNDPDTDDDGVNDWAESVAGTDPDDPGAFLKILDTVRSQDMVRITFRARGGAVSGRVYRLRAADSVEAFPGTSVDTNCTPAGGAAPWYVVTNLFERPLGEGNRFFSVEVVQ